MRPHEEHTFEALDGTPIFYRYWPAAAPGSNKAVLLLHRGHEHSGRLQHLVEELDLSDCAMFAWDARGHGRSPGRRGHAPSAGVLTKDLDTFAREAVLARGFRMEDLAVVGQSVGGVLAAAWVHDYAPPIRCLILAAPAFQVKLYVPFARPMLRVLCKFRRDLTIRSYVKAKFLTHDPHSIADFESDPLIASAISARLLLDLFDTSARLVGDSQAIHVPTQLLISGSDHVVARKPQIAFFNRLGAADKEKQEFKGFYHDTFGEKDRRLAIGKAREFILKSFSRPYERRCLLDADRTGATKEEFDRLSRPLPRGSAKAIAFRVMRGGLATGGRLSDGIRLGFETGFDSGAMLDYVYRNRASGITALGKFIDRLYLNSTGWRGVRVRKHHLERLLIRAIADLQRHGAPVYIADIAAGRGSYVLDLMKRHGGIDGVLLRDYSLRNVERGSALIAQSGLINRARFERGDAFDGASLAAIEPKPTIGVVSGLYELFPENDAVRRSLAGLAAALRPGGYIVYTGQPWHPQLEFIARTLSSHREGKPWVMRRRSQAELDQLVEAAVFQKIDQLTGDGGIFTVSLARKVAS